MKISAPHPPGDCSDWLGLDEEIANCCEEEVYRNVKWRKTEEREEVGMQEMGEKARWQVTGTSAKGRSASHVYF